MLFCILQYEFWAFGGRPKPYLFFTSQLWIIMQHLNKKKIKPPCSISIKIGRPVIWFDDLIYYIFPYEIVSTQTGQSAHSAQGIDAPSSALYVTLSHTFNCLKAVGYLKHSTSLRTTQARQDFSVGHIWAPAQPEGLIKIVLTLLSWCCGVIFYSWHH